MRMTVKAIHEEGRPAWGAIWALALMTLAMTTAQNLPVSLLTPIAADLRITEGVAGQSMTVPAASALVTSLVIAVLSQRINRRTLLLGLALLLGVSNALVAAAPSLPVLLFGRLLMGVSMGAFWPLAPALIMRLVPAQDVSRGLSIAFAGVAVSTIASAPLASYLGAIVGWRAVFWGAAALAALALVWQFAALPSLPSHSQARFATLFRLLKRPPVFLGLFAAILFFSGHSAFFTYVRPYLESVTRLGVTELSGILLAFGVAGFVGTSASGPMLKWSLSLTIAGMCGLMSLMAAGLTFFGQLPILVTVLLAFWGFGSSVVPVAWNVWLTRVFTEETESGGGLFVATAQLALMTGSAAGGAMVDSQGPIGAVVLAGSLLLVGAILIVTTMRSDEADRVIVAEPASA